MGDDNTFRIILILGFILVFPFALHFRLKSRATKEKLDRRQEGWFILCTLRPIALIWMMGMVAFLIEPQWMAWSSVGMPTWLRWGGVGLGAVSGTLLIVVMRTLGPNLTDTVVTRVRHSLVTNGPYRWVRHPFYMASLLAITADSVVAANWFLGLTGALAWGLIALRTRIEEKKLIERFGDAYRDYMKKTGRFFPRIG